jgi:hypothetical protein
VYAVEDVGKPMTSSIQAERMRAARFDMGRISQTWCDYFREGNESALERLKNKGFKIGSVFLRMPRPDRSLPAYMIQLFSPESMGLNDDLALSYVNPILTPWVVVGDNTKESTDVVSKLLQDDIHSCESHDSLVTALYYWHYACMGELIRMASMKHPTVRDGGSLESWQKGKEFYDPAKWDCYCDPFPNLRCIVRTVAERVRQRVANKISKHPPKETASDPDDDDNNGSKQDDEGDDDDSNGSEQDDAGLYDEGDDDDSNGSEQDDAGRAEGDAQSSNGDEASEA